jgi:hypothetical protein
VRTIWSSASRRSIRKRPGHSGTVVTVVRFHLRSSQLLFIGDIFLGTVGDAIRRSKSKKKSISKKIQIKSKWRKFTRIIRANATILDR